MSKGRSKAPPAPVETEESRLESFGHALYNTYTTTMVPSIFDLQLRYYGDYLHHFGFSVETERLFPPSTAAGGAAVASAPLPALTHPPTAPADADDVTRGVAWGMAPSEREEADAAASVGPLDALHTPAEVAARVAAPFRHITWRQSAAQGAMRAARALYVWLCAHIQLEARPPTPPPDAPSAADGPRRVGRPTKRPLRPPNHSAAANASGADGPTATAPPPAELALQRRRADAPGLAALYAELLRHAGLRAEVVDGLVRGRAPEETRRWAWNVVHVPREDGSTARFLVDAALSLGPPEAPAPAKESAPTGKESQSPARRRAAQAEEAPRRSWMDGPALAAAPPRALEDFYFATPPRAFAGTHLPHDGRHALLHAAPRPLQWEQAPRLTHTFFRFPIALVSHRRRCAFTVRATPFHVTVANYKPETTELCAVLYRGALAELPEDCGQAAAAALGPEWIWQQREESSAGETFTAFVPDAGYYSLVIGARAIRRDPFAPFLPSEPFVPVVSYQVLVTFVPCHAPQLPRQHLSPSICKLLAPLHYQISDGTTRFVVMPSCANVAAVAVVSRRPSEGTRELVTFLPFSFRAVAYTGEVRLRGGWEAEVWILYAAPDHNYVNATETPRTTLPSIKAESERATTSTSTRPSAQQVVGAGSSRTTPPMKLTFVPFVTRIEVRKMVAAAKGPPHISPQPTLEEEQQPTLRRLIGVTPELYEEATAVAERKAHPVGSYFTPKWSTRAPAGESGHV